MTLKSQSEYHCPQCELEWLPYASGLRCPKCDRSVPENEVTPLIAEALESARFNKRLYGRYELEIWTTRRLGDRYFEWGFKALQLAEPTPETSAPQIALAALMELDLEELAPFRAHIQGYLEALVAAFRQAVKDHPTDWQKIPEPEKPFFGRKIIDS